VNANEHTHAVESVPGIPEPIQHMQSDVMKISGQMVILTWIAFIVAAIVLHKVLWKPIVRAIEGREKEVSDALAGADQARQALADAEKNRQSVIAQAESDARQIADRATRDATAIRAKADADSQHVAQRRIEEAQRAIQAEYQKAFETLRLDAASRLSSALERMLKQNLTDEQKKKYQDELLSEVKL